MKRRFARRGFLLGTASVVGASLGDSSSVLGHPQTGDDAFDPVEHGYGFRNWSPQNQYFEVHADPTPESVREQVRMRWRDQARTVLGMDTAQLPQQLIEAIAAQVRTAVVQRAGTNGHCYGMVLTAQQYFEEPESIPVDRPVASEIEDPTVPIEEPATPVYDEIVERQAAQFLRFRAWLGRRAMFEPSWVDVPAVLRDVRAVVDSFGTATLTIFDDDGFGHQILAYDFQDRDDGIRVPIYDPNRTAPTYRGRSPALRFDGDGGSVSMEPYDQYRHVLFNRYDQIERATGRDDATPFDHLSVNRATLRESLFPLASVLVDSEDVTLTVAEPDGTEIDRVRARHMDPTRGGHARVRSLYGASPGTYRINVFGADAVDYELTTVVVDPEGTILNETNSASIELGESHEYDLEIPDGGGDEGSVERTGNDWLGTALAGGTGVAGGLAVGALGYRTVRRYRGQDGTG